MNKMTALLGSAALLAALIAGTYAYAAGGYVVAPVAGSLATQGDGTCRGFVTYAIVADDADVADDVGATTGTLEVKAGCAKLQNLVSGETYDTKAGKLDITVREASVYVLPEDPDREGPRVSGECNLDIIAFAKATDPAYSRVFRPREVRRTRADATCSKLTGLISNACIYAKGAWPADVPLPNIPACP